MAQTKRFKIGNTTVNLGHVDDNFKYQPNPNCDVTYMCNIITGNGCHAFTNRGCLPLTDIPRTTYVCVGFYRTLKCNVSTFGDVPSSDYLKDIKESLQNQLKEIEMYELELETQEKPQTLEEINLLENELENSLKELRNLKKNINDQ